MRHKLYQSPQFNPAILDINNINRMTVERIKESSSVLEIGCATGDIGEYLVKKLKCRVVGVELDSYQAVIAKTKLSNVILGNIENEKVIADLKNKFKYFDTILAMAVVEHLVDPEKTLRQLKKLMRKNSVLLITLPNVAHWTVRWSLLFGRFRYEEYGIMDRTHLHFYTLDTAKELIESAGYQLVSSKKDTVGGGYPRISRILGKIFPGLFTHQLLLVVKTP